MKLHLGCGDKQMLGYLNVDVRKDAKGADQHHDLTTPWPWVGVEEIQSYHVLEHLTRDEGLFFLGECARVLMKDGLLALELPDAKQAALEYAHGHLDRAASLWGRQRHEYDYHKWGYRPADLLSLLKELGFQTAEHLSATDSHAKHEPCFRIEASR